MGHEPLGRQLWPFQVASRHSYPPDVQFPRHPDRHRLPPPIEYIELQVGDGTANGYWSLLPGRTRPGRDIHGRLCRSIQVSQPRSLLPKVPEESRSLLLGERLPAAQHLSQPRQPPQARFCQKHAQHRGHKVHHADVLARQHLHQVGRILLPTGLGQHQAGSAQQRPEELPDRDIKAAGRLLQDAVGGAKG